MWGINKGELANVGEGELRMFKLFNTGADATCCNGCGSSSGVWDFNSVVRGFKACSGIKAPEIDKKKNTSYFNRVRTYLGR